MTSSLPSVPIRLRFTVRASASCIAFLGRNLYSRSKDAYQYAQGPWNSKRRLFFELAQYGPETLEIGAHTAQTRTAFVQQCVVALLTNTTIISYHGKCSQRFFTICGS
ncbi:unnamed protein product [Cercospora beticola]|nr:unnamed protein product [Cercospora beticola]